jgi:hypothetical protein
LVSQFSEEAEPRIEEYIEKFRKLERKGIDTRAIYLEGIKTVIGEAGTSAIVFYLGDKALLDPSSFVRRLVQIFGEGSFVFLDGMIAQGTGGKKSIGSDRIKHDKGQS